MAMVMITGFTDQKGLESPITGARNLGVKSRKE